MSYRQRRFHPGSPFSDLAVASIGAAACELADLLGARHIDVDRRRALMWFGMTLRPQDWTIPDAWDAIAGDYAARDGLDKVAHERPAPSRSRDEGSGM